MTIDKAKYLHRFSNNDVAVVVYVWEVLFIGAAIQSSVIHDFDSVIKLVKLYGTMRGVVSMTNRIHQ